MSEMKKYNFNAVTADVVRQLQNIVGGRFVIYGDEDKLESYSHDEIPGTDYRTMPEVVVRPESAKEISDIMKLANRELIPVTPRGAGSGLSGGAVPAYGGIVISMDRMNRILELDRGNMMITVEPGVVSNDINVYLKEFNLFYAGYPMSMESCYIGGNVAENAGGGKAVKYGVTSRYVLGLEMVMPDGRIAEIGGKLLKDVSGYNLLPLMTGSEGTLGIFTKIILKLIPLPKCQVDLLCLFRDTETAISLVPKLMTESGVIPTSIEFMDKDCVHVACNYLNETLPIGDAGAMLLITLDGADQLQVEKDYEKVGIFCEQAGAIEIFVADNFATSERIWKIRRNIAEAYNLLSPMQSGEDIVVPPAQIPDTLAALSEMSERYGIMAPCFGHAGDGNIHVRLISPPEWEKTRWKEVLPQVQEELYAHLKAVGGRLSGEHGIGHKRKDDLYKVVDGVYLEVLRGIKRTLDPNNIMNPGKIFDV